MDAINWDAAWATIKPLSLLILEIAVYALLIYNFYRFLARRDIFKFEIDRYEGMGGRLFYGIRNFIKNVIVYPLVLFIWFVVLAVMLGFLGKNHSTDSIMLISMGLIGAVRVASYYSEDLSRDLAKMLPFTLLGVFIVDQSYFDAGISFALIESIPDNWPLLIYYLASVFALELVLRLLFILLVVPRRKKTPPAAQPPPAAA